MDLPEWGLGWLKPVRRSLSRSRWLYYLRQNLQDPVQLMRSARPSAELTENCTNACPSAVKREVSIALCEPVRHSGGVPAADCDDLSMQSPRLIADRYSLIESLPGPATCMGWRARDLWSDQLVMIIQVPVPGLVGPALLRARHEIADEVRALGDLQHDRLVRPIDVVLDADELWVTSELLPEVTLATELTRRGAVEPAEVARWGRDVAEGLAAAHNAHVVHRNLHAEVVGLTEDGRAAVGGFATTVVTPDGLREGIPVYVAPEVARGANPSPAADIFALGAVLYTAVEGRDPFPTAAGRDRALEAVTAGVVAAPRQAGELSELLMRMLHPDPAQRPTATAVADQLRRLIAAPPEPGLPPTGDDPLAARRTRMWWLVAAAVLAVLAVAGGLLLAFRSPWTSGLPVLPAAVPAPSPSVIGDPRTADPCSLLNVGSVQRFGQLTMFGDAGYPQSCLVEITTGGNALVRLWATFDVARDENALTSSRSPWVHNNPLMRPAAPRPHSPRQPHPSSPPQPRTGERITR